MNSHYIFLCHTQLKVAISRSFQSLFPQNKDEGNLLNININHQIFDSKFWLLAIVTESHSGWIRNIPYEWDFVICWLVCRFVGREISTLIDFSHLSFGILTIRLESCWDVHRLRLLNFTIDLLVQLNKYLFNLIFAMRNHNQTLTKP
jgi:hypothetical protein